MILMLFCPWGAETPQFVSAVGLPGQAVGRSGGRLQSLQPLQMATLHVDFEDVIIQLHDKEPRDWHPCGYLSQVRSTLRIYHDL